MAAYSSLPAPIDSLIFVHAVTYLLTSCRWSLLVAITCSRHRTL